MISSGFHVDVDSLLHEYRPAAVGRIGMQYAVCSMQYALDDSGVREIKVIMSRMVSDRMFPPIPVGRTVACLLDVSDSTNRLSMDTIM